MLVKRFQIIIPLAILFPGLGHIYLGLRRRGITLLIVGIALISLWTTIPLFVSYPFNWIIISGYWAWQLADAIRLYRKMKSGVGLEIIK